MMEPVAWIEHECIWLAPHGEDERTWCCDDVYEGEGVKYVLASRLSDAEARIRELQAKLAEADALIEAQQHDFAQNNICNAENAHRAEAAEALLKEAGQVLEPFAQCEIDEKCPDTRQINAWQARPNYGDIRAARAIHDKIGVKDE